MSVAPAFTEFSVIMLDGKKVETEFVSKYCLKTTEENFDGKMKIILSSKPYISMRPNRNADALKSLNTALEKYSEIAQKQS